VDCAHGVRGKMGDRSPWDGIDADACCRYVLGRQTREGGFSFYAHHDWGVEEPNTLDTYAAIAALQLLRAVIPNARRCEDWLKEQQEPSGAYATLVIGHTALKALRLLAAEPQYDPRPFIRRWDSILRPTRERKPLPGWLADVARWIELCADFGVAPSAEMQGQVSAALAAVRCKGGGYASPGENLADTARVLEISARIGLDAPDGILAYARQCEALPFGFNMTPAGAGSNLEALLSGLRILRYYGVEPSHPEHIRRYVAACQTATGGFGRAPGAIAQLTETLRALEVLMLLATAEA
jgi:hypothetical protein